MTTITMRRRPFVVGGNAADWARLIVATLARAVIFTVLGMMFWSAAPTAIGFEPTTVMTDSMAPRIRAGDVVVAKAVEASELRQGQVLLLDDPDHAGRLRLHRFSDVTADGLIVTKGDANQGPDSTPNEVDAVHGVGFLRIPMVGMPIVWIHEKAWVPVALSAAALLALMYLSRIDGRLRSRKEAVLALALVATLVISGGASAAFSRTTANPVTAFSTTNYPCLDRSPSFSPFLYYAYNEASGTKAEDSSPAGRDGTLTTGATRSEGNCTPLASPVLNLNGSSGQVTTPTSVTAPIVFTIETWFRTSTTRGGKIIGFGNSQSGTSTKFDRHLYMTNAGKLVFGVYTTSAVTITSPLSYNNGVGHLVTATLSGAGMALYVDGALVASSAAAKTAEANTGYWRIGYDNLAEWPTPPTSNFFAGSLDGTAVYTTALTPAQVDANWNKGP